MDTETLMSKLNTAPLLTTLILLCLLSFPGIASAVTIDFEATQPGNYSTLSTNGYTFSPTYHSDLSVYATGGTNAISPKWGDRMTLRPVSDATFSFTSLTYRGRWSGVNSSVNVVGTRANGSQVTASFSYTASSWGSRTFNWTDLVRVDFYTPGGRVMLDNIVVNSTPSTAAPGVDFESVQAGNYNPLTTNGYQFTSLRTNTLSVLDDGANNVLAPKWGDSVALNRSDNSPFSLQSLDYKGYWPNISSRVEITGTKSNGSQVTALFNYSYANWGTKTLSWTDLVKVEFFMPGGRVVLDDFVMESTVQPGCQPTARETTMLNLVNNARASGRNCGNQFFAATTPLTWNCQLRDAAAAHTNDMVDNNFFNHTGSDGLDVSNRVTATGYTWRTVGENIAAGYPNEQQVVQGLLSSEGHCKNIMNPAYEDFGSAVEFTNQADYSSYWTQVFAAPR